MSAEKFPLGVAVSVHRGDPYVVRTPSNKAVLVSTEFLKNEHGDVFWIHEIVVNANPTEEEVFLAQLKNGYDYKLRIDIEDPIEGIDVAKRLS